MAKDFLSKYLSLEEHVEEIKTPLLDTEGNVLLDEEGNQIFKEDDLEISKDSVIVKIGKRLLVNKATKAFAKGALNPKNLAILGTGIYVGEKSGMAKGSSRREPDYD